MHKELNPLGKEVKEYPASFEQQLDLLENPGDEYCFSESYMILPFRASGPLDLDALAAAVDAIVERNEVLRTTLRINPDGSATQVVHENTHENLVVHTASSLPSTDLVSVHFAFSRLSSQDIPRQHQTGLRAHVAELGRGEFALQFQLNNLYTDGPSVGLFELDFIHAYIRAISGLGMSAEPLRAP